MRVPTLRRWHTTGEGFEGIRELEIRLRPAPSLQDSLRRSPFVCRRGGPELTVFDCLQCQHFVNWRPDPAYGRATLRCLFSDDDPVRDLMTPVEAMVFVDPDLSQAEAEEVALKNDTRHLLVSSGDEVVGIACRCDLAKGDADATVGDVAAGDPWCVAPDATLGEVARLFREEEIGMALVVEGQRLVGLVTRGDLRRSGCPEELLGARYCSACKSPHGVIEHPALAVDICIDCLELARSGDGDEGQGG